jgi:aminopeptidase N
MRLLAITFVFIVLTSGVRAKNADTIWNKAVDCFIKENYHGVIDKMNEYLMINPGNPNAIYNRGLARLKLGDNDRACLDFLNAVAFGFNRKSSLIRYYCDPSYKLKFLKKFYYKKQELLPENNYSPGYTRADTLRGALRPERTCFDVYYYDLKVRIIPKGKKISGSNDIYFIVLDSCRHIQIDLYENYTISSIRWNNQELDFMREFNAVFIKFPRELTPGEKNIVTVEYSGKPGVAEDPPWKGGFVWKRDKKFNRWVAVACEHLGASSWWPNKDHLTDEPDSMTINIEVPDRYVAVSNGVLRRTEEADNSYKRFVWFVSYPINNYNVTFYMGKYTQFNDTLIMADNDKLLMKYHVLPYNLDKAMQHFKQALEVVGFYSDIYGKYPFIRDGFGLVESPYAGMEHQTAIAYGNSYGNKNDHGYRNNKYDYIIVHEAAHEWWGNSVSAGDMADAWIHEAFATYSELLFIEHVFGKEEYLYELGNKCNYIYNFWPMVENRDVNENSFAGNDIYTKGAMMLHCLRCTIDNDSLFFKIIKDFYNQNSYKIVDTDCFINFVNKETKENYTPFFKKYLYETRLPVIQYSFIINSDNLVFTYKWTEVDDGFRMPFCIETSGEKAIRLVGTTYEQRLVLESTSWFNFFNCLKGPAGAEDHSFTYFRTSCTE